jgi:hypothetical protein
MSNASLNYPIDGPAVCRALQDAAGFDEQWIIRSIETLTSRDSLRLGDLWRQSNEADVIISTRELCEALKDADQVITLDIYLRSNKSIELLIEDSMAIINGL